MMRLAIRSKPFIVTHHGDVSKQATLQGFCAQHISKYMIPHQIEFRDALPKTSTGKVNKMALRQTATS